MTMHDAVSSFRSDSHACSSLFIRAEEIRHIQTASECIITHQKKAFPEYREDLNLSVYSFVQ